MIYFKLIKMNKIISILILGMLVLSGLTVVATTKELTDDLNFSFVSEKIDIKIPSPKCVIENNYARYYFEDEELYVLKANEPILPKKQKIFELPFGSKNIDVKIDPKNVIAQPLDMNLEISPAPQILIDSDFQISTLDDEQKSTSSIFPSTWYSYKIGCGLNSDIKHATQVIVDLFPLRYDSIEDELLFCDDFDIAVNYDQPTISITSESEYELLIIAPKKFSQALQPLIDHKNSFGISTVLKNTEDIYRDYQGRDKPEKIKYFLAEAFDEWNMKYVLLVGGLNSFIWATPKDDDNQGSKDWNVPVRYTNVYDNPKYPLASSTFDPGVISDLYYADIWRYDSTFGRTFEDWDPNGDNIFFAWNRPGIENDTGIDFLPDVSLGRLACVNVKEVELVVNKIINYEKSPCDPSWFKKMIVVSGDGFLDQQDLNITWDTSELPEDNYTIYAQSTNSDQISGPIDTINITIDRSVTTNLTFNHDDNLKSEIKNGYPAPPIAEIVTISEGNILGNTDYFFCPGEGKAYCNDFNPWANMSYINGVLTIRGKSYDPQPYGNITNIHVWIENELGETVFSDWRNNTEMYFEGEWTTGEKELLGRGGALYYMPSDFQREILWASNGKLTGESDVIEAVNQGCGFLFLSGHGSPNVWADHFPGVPGNRNGASFTGLRVTSLNLYPKAPYLRFPLFPMNQLENGEKLPIAVIGGCHNSQFNVSMIPAFLHIMPYIFKNLNLPKKAFWTYGAAVPETFSWFLISRPDGGAIATMGNTGLGYGMPGKMCTSGGGDSWITIEFFRQYGEEGKEILGDAYTSTLTSYINTFDMGDLGAGHPKTVQQWILLGDPSLRIGGFS